MSKQRCSIPDIERLFLVSWCWISNSLSVIRPNTLSQLPKLSSKQFRILFCLISLFSESYRVAHNGNAYLLWPIRAVAIARDTMYSRILISHRAAQFSQKKTNFLMHPRSILLECSSGREDGSPAQELVGRQDSLL